MIFSVVTPSFKSLPWLRLAVASVRDQVHDSAALGKESPTGVVACSPKDSPLFHVEHIVQDACSPGIEEFAREVDADFYRDGQLIFRASSVHPRYSLTIISESDSGMYDAINRGFSRAKGHILSWLNCDEQYLPGCLATVNGFLSRNPTVDAVVGDMILVDSRGEILSYRKSVMAGRIYIRMHHLSIPSCTTFYRKSAVFTTGPIDASRRVIADALWVSSMLTHKMKYRTFPQPLAAFSLTGDNLSDQIQARAELEEWQSTSPLLYRVLSRPMKLLHWIHKLFSGAYTKRPVGISLYTFSSPDVRVTFEREKTPTNWPLAG